MSQVLWVPKVSRAQSDLKLAGKQLSEVAAQAQELRPQTLSRALHSTL